MVVAATVLDSAAPDLPHSPFDLCLPGTDTFAGGLQGAATGNAWMCHEQSLIFYLPFLPSGSKGWKWDLVQLRTSKAHEIHQLFCVHTNHVFILLTNCSLAALPCLQPNPTHEDKCGFDLSSSRGIDGLDTRCEKEERSQE